jgi:hypothetical protein
VIGILHEAFIGQSPVRDERHGRPFELASVVDSAIPALLINALTGQVRLGGDWNHRSADVMLFGNSTAVVFETVERHSSILADLDEVAVGITHIATPFPTVIV